jgi:hypothetical protein
VGVSGPAPKTYAFETIALCAVLLVALILVLKSSWSGY